MRYKWEWKSVLDYDPPLYEDVNIHVSNGLILVAQWTGIRWVCKNGMCFNALQVKDFLVLRETSPPVS